MIVPKKQLHQWIEPVYLAENLIHSFGDAGFIWLDSDGTKTGRWIILGVDPVEQICSRDIPPTKNSVNPFDLLRELRPGHWTGWLSYEAGAWIEPKNPWKKDPMAILWIASHDPVIKCDLKENKLWLQGCDPKRFSTFSKWLNKLAKRKSIVSTNSQKLNQKGGIPITSWKWLTEKDQYANNVEVIQNWIKKGDIFQANLSTCCIAKKPQDFSAIDIFKRLRIHCPAPFSGIIIGSGDANEEAIISSSPERFLKVSPNGEIETRPIKGTRPRKKNIQEDADMAADLICSQKDIAENIMIVDLLRNDLGKVCKPGSIHVTKLVGLESYAQVHHLTSVIRGILKENNTWIDLLEACWPGGSITGAPKLRACKRLHELEPVSRGPYCGSLIHIDWEGKFDSNILIRSCMMKGSTLRVNAGCGIVADSDPDNEADELTWKLMPVLKALE